MSTTTAVILAAGYGSRLGAAEGHKILAEVGGKALLDWHVDAFARAGVTDLIIVTGFNHEALTRTLQSWRLPAGMRVRTVFNAQFDLSNGVSILSANAQPPFWLAMGDHLIQPALFDTLPAVATRMAADDIGGALAIDYALADVFDMPDANKLRFDDGALAAIGKDLTEFDCVDVGLFWCDQPFLDALEAERAARGDCNTSDAMRRLDAAGRAAYWDIGDAWWQDVDTPGARAHAEQLVAGEPYE